MARNHEEYLRNFYLKSARAVARAYNEGPAAYVLPANDPRKDLQARLVNLLPEQGAEVSRAGQPGAGPGRHGAGAGKPAGQSHGAGAAVGSALPLARGSDQHQRDSAGAAAEGGVALCRRAPTALQRPARRRPGYGGAAGGDDVPSGQGHMVLFAINPMWRGETEGSYALELNAMLNYSHLGLSQALPPAQPSKSGE